MSPHWSQKQHNIVYYYFHRFMVRVTNQLAFRVMIRLLACSWVLSVSCSIGPNRYIFLDSDWFIRVYVVTGHTNVVGFRPLSTRMWTFLKLHIIFPWFVWRPALHHSGERLLKDTVSVSWFTGFVWTKGKNIRRFINICIRADVALVKRICLFKASLRGCVTAVQFILLNFSNYSPSPS